jgi:hypothetical protein
VSFALFLFPLSRSLDDNGGFTDMMIVTILSSTAHKAYIKFVCGCYCFASVDIVARHARIFFFSFLFCISWSTLCVGRE